MPAEQLKRAEADLDLVCSVQRALIYIVERQISLPPVALASAAQAVLTEALAAKSELQRLRSRGRRRSRSPDVGTPSRAWPNAKESADFERTLRKVFGP